MEYLRKVLDVFFFFYLTGTENITKNAFLSQKFSFSLQQGFSVNHPVYNLYSEVPFSDI